MEMMHLSACRRRIVRALHVDGWLERRQQLLGGVLVEDGHVLDDRKRGEQRGPLALWHEGSRRPLEASRGGVAVEAYDQEIAKCPRLLEVSNMAQMQQVEAAVGKDGPLTLLLTYLHMLRQGPARHHRSHWLLASCCLSRLML